MDFSQKSRFMNIVTPLGPDIFAVEHFSCRDAISDLFHMEMSLLSKVEAVKPGDIVGHPITVNIVLADGSERPFHGIVSEMRGGHKTTRDLRRYELVVVPWLWFLTRRKDCRIFQAKTIIEIIEDVFSELGFADYKLGPMMVNHPIRDYCVQYRESDFEFISRLMEEEGIFYFWEHEKGKHTLVLSDDKSCYQTCQESRIPVIPGTSGIKAAIKSWTHHYQFCSGKWSLTDYNFEQPSTSLATNTPTILKLKDVAKYEVYDYPGEYGSKADGTPLTKVRMEATEAAHDKVHAKSECQSLFSGGTFTVQHDEIPSEDKQDYVITFIEHTASDLSYSTKGGGFHYENTFTCIPSSQNARAERKTPRPQIHGSQTAVVVGPSGEEIYVDEFSRVKVQFHWDRLGGADENSSCWIRVAQNWAGKKWGQIFIPRIGQEVVVNFLEGDPDRPLIVGSVYNGEQMPPYELPANKTQSGIKTRSSKGGDPSTFNEIRFEDKKGSEHIYIHAEKDEITVVENDQTTHVMHDQFIKVDNDRSEEIGRDRSLTVNRHKYETVLENKAIKIGQSHTEMIGNSMNITIGSSLTETVTTNYTETVGLAMSVSVGAKYSLTVGGAKTESIGVYSSENIAGYKSIKVGENHSLSVGKNQSITVDKDSKTAIGGKSETVVDKEIIIDGKKKIQITAADEILLKVGKATVSLKKNGDITVNGGKINIKGTSTTTIKGSKIDQN